MNQSLSALLSGTVFGAGLAVGQMTNPAKVLGFLDVAGAGIRVLRSSWAQRFSCQPSLIASAESLCKLQAESTKGC